MKRRGFFKTLIGLALAPLASKVDSDPFPSWNRGVSSSRAESERKLLQATSQIEDDFWRPPTKEPYGISYWLKK